METKNSLFIEASGTVQGVGFRFFVCKLAIKFALKGYVRNIGLGTETLVQGDKQNIDDFFAELKKAGFKAVYKQKEVSAEVYKDFKIAETIR